jgi:hypothetical protein
MQLDPFNKSQNEYEQPDTYPVEMRLVHFTKN